MPITQKQYFNLRNWHWKYWKTGITGVFSDKTGKNRNEFKKQEKQEKTGETGRPAFISSFMHRGWEFFGDTLAPIKESTYTGKLNSRIGIIIISICLHWNKNKKNNWHYKSCVGRKVLIYKLTNSSMADDLSNLC